MIVAGASHWVDVYIYFVLFVSVYTTDDHERNQFWWLAIISLKNCLIKKCMDTLAFYVQFPQKNLSAET